MMIAEPQPGMADPSGDLLAREQAEIAGEKAKITSDYWAAATSEKVVEELQKKERAFESMLVHRGFVRQWREMYARLHGLEPDDLLTWGTQQIQLDGEDGELIRFRVNETRSFFKQSLTMATGMRPAFKCGATNTDSKALGEVEGCDDLISYVYETEYGEKKETKTVWRGAAFGVSYTWINWDEQGGTPITEEVPVMRTLPDGTQQPALDPTTGEPLTRSQKTGQMSGSVSLKSKSAWEVFQEPYVEDADDHLWKVVKEKRSKWEIASRYPELREKILALGSSRTRSSSVVLGFDSDATGMTSTDEIEVKHFYHKRSTALGNGDYASGRHIVYAETLPIDDEGLLFPDIPLIPFMPGEYMGTCMGYADSWDMCSVNEMLDQIISDVATNLSNLGRQVVAVEDGTSISTLDIANGGRVLSVPQGGKIPQSVMLADIPAQTPWFVDFLAKRFQSYTGMNGVTRGEPDASVTSGTMAALFHSIAIEFNSALQGAINLHRKLVANMILETLQRFAELPMIAKIVGIDERPYFREFTKSDFTGVRGVTVETANPLMRTQAGRLQLAEMQMKLGSIENADQLNEILVSGKSKPMYDAKRKRGLRIRSENEALFELAQKSRGIPPEQLEAQHVIQTITPDPLPPLPNGMQPPPPQPYKCVPSVPTIFLDNHPDHIHEHYTLLTSPEATRNPALRSIVLSHIEHHLRVWKDADPAVLSGLGLPVFPGGGQQAPQQQHPGASSEVTAPQSTVPPGAMQGQQAASAGVKLPNPATSPVPSNSGVQA